MFTYRSISRIAALQDIIDDLYNIVVELDARETSNNCVVDDLQRFGWDELCDKGIEILEKLKKI